MSLGSAVSLAAERIVMPVERMHRAIARPWFAALGTLGKPVHLAHDVISRVVYGSIRFGAVVVGSGLDARIGVDSSSAGAAQAVVNGLWGDTLGRHEPHLGTALSIRDRAGAAIAPGPDLIAGFPNATGQLVVLVHGLAVTERCWHDTGAGTGLLSSLEEHPHFTPVPIRYNTGLPVATNGAQLASLLERIYSDWPQPVESIALVGHSMGGLVIRSACTTAQRAGHRWVEDVDDVVAIGSPHKGAPLEKLVHVAAGGLNLAPQTQPLADFLNGRSRGIKDLRSGSIRSAANTGPDLGSKPSGIRYHFIAGVITSDPANPIGAAVGDLMVRPGSSATAPALEPTNVVVLGGVNHFDLPHEPAVIDRVMGWLNTSQLHNPLPGTRSRHRDTSPLG